MDEMRDAALLARGVTFSYPQLTPDLPRLRLFDGLSLRLGVGKALTVMGASGSGKSTLCYVLAGLAPRYTAGSLEGEVRVLGHDVTGSAPGADVVGVLFQDAATQLFNTTVEHEVAWGLEALALPSAEITRRVHEALIRFGLLGERARPPWALSGGQQKRLALAALWAQRPDVLLLDEPLEGLDPVGRGEVRGALELLRAEGATLLFTTAHVPPGMAEGAVAKLGAILSKGSLSPPRPLGELGAQEGRLVATGLLCPDYLWSALSSGGGVVGSEPALVARDLHFAYQGGPEVLRGVDLAVPRGQFVALVGPNGAGKTTLTRHFNGLLRPTGGALGVLGQDVAALSVGQLARRVGYLFQRPEQQIFGTTVREEVAYGPHHLNLPDADERILRALVRFDLRTVAHLPPAILGYGTQRAVTLATLAALGSPILVLDEPMVGLDGRGRAQLLSWLAELRAQGTTLVVVTHEMELAAAADRVIVLEGGRVVEDGEPERVLAREALP
jgi:energy-coupling factor transport system ATP-binding protein